MSSAGTRAAQFFSNAVIDGVLIRDALVDTGSVYSMVSSALHDRLPSRPAINLFNNSAPEPRYRWSRRRVFQSQKLYRRSSADRWNRGGTPAARPLGVAVRDVDRHNRVVTTSRKLSGM